MNFRIGSRIFQYRSRSLIAAMALIGACVASWRVGRVTDALTQAKSSNLLVCRQEMGQQWAAKDFEWIVGLTNPTDETVEIENILPACRCSQLEPSSLSLAPGESADVTLTLDTRPNYADLAQAKKFPFNAGFTVETANSSPVKSFRFNVSGEVRNPARVQPFRVEFTGSREIVAGLDPPTQKLHVQWSVPVRSVKAIAGTDELFCEIEAFSKGTTEHFVAVTPVCGDQIGKFESEFSLVAHTMDGTQFPIVVVPVSGRILPDIQAVPGRVDFGACILGTTASTAVLLQSMSGCEFSIERVSLADDTPSVNVTVRKGDSASLHRIHLNVEVESLGMAAGTVILEIESDHGRSVQRVGYAIYGTEPTTPHSGT